MKTKDTMKALATIEDAKLTARPKRLAIMLIKQYSKGGHPFPDMDSIGGFTQAFVASLARKCIARYSRTRYADINLPREYDAAILGKLAAMSSRKRA